MNTLYVILLSVLIVGLCVFGLCFNIIFRKDGRFPDSEVGHNKELRKRGVVCMREEDERIWGKSTHIKVTGKKGLRKIHPDSECESCDVSCRLKELINR
jgi:hypothetical protein